VAVRDDERFIPNDDARSSLFTARNKREPRRTLLHEKLFHLHQTVSILYTGLELRAEDDEIVWMQILHYGKNVPLGATRRPARSSWLVGTCTENVSPPKNQRNARSSISTGKSMAVLMRCLR
jgi:hypothetical protein